MTSTTRQSRDRATVLAALLAAVLLAVYLLTRSGFIYVLVGAAAVATLVFVVRHRATNRRRSWLLLAGGLACLVVGDLLSLVAVDATGVVPTFPSPADAAYLLGYPLLGVGIRGFAAARRRSPSSVADALILTIAAMLLMQFVAVPADAVAEAAFAQIAIALIYPAADVFLLVLAAHALLGRSSRSGARLLLAAFGILLVSDVLFSRALLSGTVGGESLLGVGGILTYALFALGGLRGVGELAEVHEGAPSAWHRILGVAVATLIAPFVLIVAGAAGEMSEAILALVGAGITLLVLVGLLRVKELARTIEGANHDLAAAARRQEVLATAGRTLAGTVEVADVRGAVEEATRALLRVYGLRSVHLDLEGLSTRVADLLEPVPFTTVEDDEDGLRSHVTVAPIADEDSTFGVIFARTNSPPDEPDVEALRALGLLVSMTLSRIWLSQAFEVREQRFHALVQHAPDAVTLTDATGTIVYASPAVRHFGIDPDGVIGTRWDDSICPDDRHLVRQAAADIVAEPSRVRAVEYRWIRPDGRTVWIESILSNRLTNPAVAGVIANHRDVTERRRLEAQLAKQAQTDALTGLPNRWELDDWLRLRLADSRTTAVGLLFLDIDRFKPVNDGYGHTTGDEILRVVGQRIRRSIRPGDLAARVGGDEFAVVLDGVADSAAALAVAERVREEIGAPIAVDREVITVSASIGVVIADPGSDVEGELLLRRADAAMYVAKAGGRDRVELFDPSSHDDVLDRVRLEADLRSALIDRDQLRVDYQPFVDLASGEIRGAEALIRWEHPTRGELQPGQFIPMAEEVGLISQIGAHVLRRACVEMAEVQAATGVELAVSVNVSPQQFLDPTLPEDVARALALSELAPHQLLLEITESSLLSDVDVALEVLKELRRLGVGIAIDDFGTGYSSLGYLRRLPVDVLKLDMSFVDGIDGSVEDSAVARAIVRLAGTFQLKSIAEGIERIEQLEVLRTIGCEYGQGFLFAPAIGTEELVTMINVGSGQRGGVSTDWTDGRNETAVPAAR